ncbi:maleylpyruvate isomerase family mycothiol-dependent enzyme [Georgenia alba]|uniref:Maleylpyruvate isomerase family mycothiol-dependent enzyme n=1 Tax=Georgenia alba TaxID=2233858 RepID=A0ABW2Q7W1_9MICO
MPTELSVTQHLEGLRAAVLALTAEAFRAGLRAEVPTCPGWRVRDLLAHQGMVHRWAAAQLRGADGDSAGWEEEGRRHADPLEWLRDGAVELARQLTDAPDDLAAKVFLRDAPRPRAFWARRQCHETTIHAVDAQAAALGRPPDTGEVDWITPELAADGIDELLGGFLPRRRSRLRLERAARLVVAPRDAPWSWLVELGPEPPVTTRHAGGRESDADWAVTGSAVELYLRLWNRTDEPLTGDGLDWAGLAQVTWH